MARKQVEAVVECGVGIEALWKGIGRDKIHYLREAAPHLVNNCEILQGDGGVGTLLLLYPCHGSRELLPVKEKIVELDEEGHLFSFEVLEGGLTEGVFSYCSISFKLDAMGEGRTLARITVKYEPESEIGEEVESSVAQELLDVPVSFVRSIENHIISSI